MLGNSQWGDVQFVTMLFGLAKVVLDLLIHPAFSRRVKGDGQSYSHLGANARLSVEETRESTATDTERFGCSADAQAQRLQA